VPFPSHNIINFLSLSLHSLHSHFGNRQKKAAAGNDDGNTTNVDDDGEDIIVVPAGFIEVAENLVLLQLLALTRN
jgi:hypothetical protein